MPLRVFIESVSKTHQSAYSLHQAAGTWQEVLDVSDCCFGEIGHGAIATTRSAVVEKVADSGCWVLLKEILTGAVGFLVTEEKVVGQMQDAIHVDDAADVVHVYVRYQAHNHHSLH